MKEKSAEFWVVAILSCLAVYFLTLVDEIKFTSLPGGLGPRTFPRAIFILILVLSAILVLMRFLEKKETVDRKKNRNGRDQDVVWRIFPFIDPKVLTVAFMSVGFMVLWEKIGFLISSVAFVFFTALVVAPPEKRSVRNSAVLAVCFTAIIAFFFAYLFEIPLELGFFD